jgi:hypothetical protein
LENKRKFFSPELFAENDLRARTAFRALMEKEQLPFEVVDNPKKLGVDLLLYQDGIHTLNVELEIKKVWKEGKFAYKDVNLPLRKKKYCDPTLIDKPTVFVMFSADTTQFLTIKGEDVIVSDVVEVNNRFVFKGEYFFKVPIEKVTFNSLGVLHEFVKKE